VLGECLDKARLQQKWSLIARCKAIHLSGFAFGWEVTYESLCFDAVHESLSLYTAEHGIA